MTKTFFIGFILLLGIGCSSNKQKNNNYEIQELNFQTVGLHQNDLMKPWAICLFDSLLLIADQYDGKGISVINLNKRQLVKRIISIGRGPNEVLSTFRTTKIGKSLFQVESPNLKKTLVFSIDSIMETCVLKPVKKINFKFFPLKEDEIIYRLYQVNDSLFTGLGGFNNAQHILFKKNYKQLNRYQVEYKYDYPPINQQEHKNVNNFSKYSLFTGNIAISPNQYHMVFACYSCFYYKVFNIENASINKIYERIDYLPEYKIVGSDKNVAFSIKSKQGFHSPYATNEAFYLLHMTRTMVEYGSYCQYTRELLRIGWDGKIKQKFMLDRDTDYIAVDEKDKRIYATCLNNKTNYVELGYYDF